MLEKVGRVLIKNYLSSFASLGVLIVLDGCTMKVFTPSTSSSTATADHLVLISGNNQSAYPFATLSQSLRVQVQDSSGNAYTGGVTLGLMRMLGNEATSYVAKVKTDSSGYASFSVKLGSAQTAWQVVPMGSTLPNLSGKSCSTGNTIGFSCGTKIGFKAAAVTLGNGSFDTGLDVTTGASPFWAAVGDLRGNGVLDIIASSSSGADVLLGNGDGTFQPKSTYLVGTAYGENFVADFNGDGKLDLAEDDLTSSAVQVLLGNGDGTLQTRQPYATASATGGERQMAGGDFNEDGYIDLVVPRNSAGKMSVLLNNGDGSFASFVNYTTGSQPVAVVAADFNGDGHLDLLVSNASSQTLGYFQGNGDGTFKSQVSTTVGTNPAAITLGDFNGDGYLDVMVGATTLNMRVFLGRGDGTFQTPSVYGVTGQVFGVGAFGDIRGLGIMDLVNPSYGDTHVDIEQGDGSGSFVHNGYLNTSGQPYSLVLADFNGDHKLDFVIGQNTVSQVMRFLGQ